MGQVGWIKLSTDIFSNRKIKILLKEKDGDTYFRLWIQILTIAGECNRNGGLYISDNVPFKIEDFTNIIGKSSKTFTKVLQKFVDLGMLIYKDDTYFVKNWNRYQSTEKFNKIIKSTKVIEENENEKSSENETIDKIRKDKTWKHSRRPAPLGAPAFRLPSHWGSSVSKMVLALAARPARPCSSLGMMILVALPSATFSMASRAFSFTTWALGAASFSSFRDSARAVCTWVMAWASASAARIWACFSPSAFRMAACLAASAFRMAACFSPSATRIWDCFCPSAWRMDSRRSRSAFICFSMAFWISLGGMMFFSSTRLALMVSRLVRDWSSSISPMMLRRVVAVRFSMAFMGRSTP